MDFDILFNLLYIVLFKDFMGLLPTTFTDENLWLFYPQGFPYGKISGKFMRIPEFSYSTRVSSPVKVLLNRSQVYPKGCKLNR